MRRTMTWAVLALFGGLVGCALFQPVGTPIYQDGSLAISLEPNPEKAGPVQDGQAQQTITAQQLADVLRGLEARKVTGVLQSSVGLSEFEPVFRTDELWLVAGEIQKGLRQASPQERIAFQLWRPRGKGREETRGSIYLRGRILYVTLSRFRVSDRMDYEGAEGGSGKAVELLYEPSEAVVQRQQGFASQWLAADAAEVLVDIRRVTGSYEPRTPPPTPAVAAPSKIEPKVEPAMTPQPSQASSAATAEALQRQVKDLTEELNRLRQELAEAKQLLADKVLELERLKSKSGGVGKGEAVPSPLVLEPVLSDGSFHFPVDRQ